MTKVQRERNMLLVEDLRTFKGQAKEYLRREGRFCCLGRACEVFRLNTGKGYWDGNHFVLGKVRAVSLPPSKVATWFGWNRLCPAIDIGTDKDTAHRLNDSGRRFATIARGFEALAKAK